ncbi:single-stranded DNA-binding protein [Porphyromonas levii]|uniref:Single-stranded DNA-binding protein n=1 Tax=Porphyromonas levii TaxID=28114 RepID=A0A4Y8WND0_9PORP|nr:single-stranded DNA-binding protein [Porphyromonas levii]MBR8713880.1 Single-stranded DNA-binding protein [Porphyromonas levii]MBR8715879.1 Single-stranded DNA-binding protein [Porphyromonas levii]MBR8728414.1 Single-stranded DNA-binding protein [Porphyromonas levii]MBR8729614.1 Single-stranded DNA-binding protein [Porphyromonas levii]MBR8730686.1 Single-stranded DNA-binding protein [Porphyromonas levii]
MDKTENVVRLVGYLGTEPQVQWYDADSCMVRLSVATHAPSHLSEEGRECSGEVTDWHRVVCYQKDVVARSKELNTGDLVAIEGRLTYAKRYGQKGQVTLHTFVVARQIELVEKQHEEPTKQPQEERARLDRYGRYFETLQEDKDGLPF